MLIVADGTLNPELVAAVQAFRGAIYAADGAVAPGPHVEALDARSYHLILWRGGAIAGTLRYTRKGRGEAKIGGWAMAPDARGTRASIRLALEAVRLAERLGDTYGTATATVRHGSAEILKRLGGKCLMRYHDAAYGCEMEYLTFTLADMQHRRAA